MEHGDDRLARAPSVVTVALATREEPLPHRRNVTKRGAVVLRALSPSPGPVGLEMSWWISERDSFKRKAIPLMVFILPKATNDCQYSCLNDTVRTRPEFALR